MVQLNDDEINLKEMIGVLFKKRNILLYCSIGFCFALIALIFSLLQQPVYESRTTILVKGASTPISGRFAGLVSMLGLGQQSMGFTTNDLIEIIRSRVVTAKVLDDLKLKEKIKGWDNPMIKRTSLISAVAGMLKSAKVFGNIIELKTETNDPQLAAELANGFINAFSYYWNELNYTEAQKKMKYIRSELPRVERELKSVEAKLMLSPRSVTGFSLGGQGGVQREFEIYNSVYTMLKKELESAKLDTSKEIPPFSVIDVAEKPLYKIRPKTKFNVLIGLMLGLFSGIFVAFFREYWEKSK